MLTSEKWLLDNQDKIVPLEKWQRTVDIMAKILSAPAGYIVQHTAEGYQVVIASDQTENPYSPGGVIPSDTNIFCRRVVKTHHQLYVKNALAEGGWEDNPEVTDDGFSSYLGLPILWPNGDVFGTICVMDFNPTDYKDEFVELMGELRDLIQSDLAVQIQYQVLRDLAMTDELTGLLNRRGFNLVAGQRISLSQRSKMLLGMLFLDLNGLKELNDTIGHEAGDKAIVSFAESIKNTVRESDIAARIGGDEFVVIVSLNHPEELQDVAQRIDKGYAGHEAGFSTGRIIIDDFTKPLEYWVSQADEAMYIDKQKNL